jgi:hypothetical protein
VAQIRPAKRSARATPCLSQPAGGVPSSVFCLVGKDLARIEKHFFFAGSRLDAHCRLILLEGAPPAKYKNWVG